ncbi:MAG: hypothetical protein AAF228_03165 [Pseudomonadota bacterium]
MMKIIQKLCVYIFICTFVFAVIAVTQNLPARAQGVEQLTRSYLTPFPKGEKYTIYIIGDAFAGSVKNSLEEVFKDDRRLQIKGALKSASGLAKIRGFNWNNKIRTLLRQEKIHAAVILLGLQEHRNIRLTKNNRSRIEPFGSEEWQKIMSKRVQDIMLKLKKEGVAVYWMGLPIMRSPKKNQSAQVLNSVFRQQAFLNGFKFINTWNGFADQFGRYSAYGADLSGKVRRLRAKDGVGFTKSGYRKLAHFAEREILRDIALAKSERNIPLAGDEKEQQRVQSDLKAKITKRKIQADPKKEQGESFFTSLQRRLLGGNKANQSTSKSNYSVTLDDGIKIVRPPLPDVAFSRSAVRRRSSPLASGVGTALIAKTIGSDLTALASITPANELTLKAAKQSVPLQQTPYYKVLVLGETLPSKPGRADDFIWQKDN